MNFKKWVKSIQTAGYNGARTVSRLADLGFFLDSQYQGGVKSTVSGVFEDLKFKISEGYKQN